MDTEMAFEFVLMLLIVFFGALALRQQVKKAEIGKGSLDEVILELMDHYQFLRDHREELGVRVFAFGPAWEAGGDRFRNAPLALAVSILDEKGKKREGAGPLGMEVLEAGGRYHYQLTSELEEKLSDAELNALLSRLMKGLEKRFPDDMASLGPACLTMVADGKKALDHLEAVRRKRAGEGRKARRDLLD